MRYDTKTFGSANRSAAALLNILVAIEVKPFRQVKIQKSNRVAVALRYSCFGAVGRGELARQDDNVKFQHSIPIMICTV